MLKLGNIAVVSTGFMYELANVKESNVHQTATQTAKWNGLPIFFSL
jgi:hypothetical protein